MSVLTKRLLRRVPAFERGGVGLAVALTLSCVAGCGFNPCVNGGDIHVDSDGDVIPDCLETDGVDINNDHIVDAVTHTNPQHKDIFVKIDWMDCGTDTSGTCADGHDHQPIQDSLNDVAAALANSPISNPDGVDGISLQVQLGEALAHQDVCGCDCLANLVDNQRQVLTAEERANAHASDLLEAKRKVVHYFLWGHDHDDSSSSGVACDNGYTEISLGRWGGYGTRAEQAGTLLHELGHQLGLGHGGGDGVNNKPNYLSVMNYSFQTRFSSYLPALDYSRSELAPLNEDSLTESLGIGANSGIQTKFFDIKRDGVDVSSQGGIDWNRDGDATDVINTGLDLNNDGICVQAGTDNNLDSRTSGDDQYFAKNRSGWMVLSDTTRAAVGDDDKYVDPGTSQTRISTGPDTLLNTPVQAGDTLVMMTIVDGPDHTCDSTRAGDDKAVAASGATEQRTLNGYNDWGNIHLDLLFRLKGGLGDTPPSPLNNPSVPELTLQESMEQQVSDVAVDVTPTFTARRGLLQYEVRVSNGGPASTTGPVHVDLFLPATAASVTCQVQRDGTCVQSAAGSKVLIDTPPLAVGETRSFTVKLNVDASACATPAVYAAKVAASLLNIDPDASNDHYSIPFPDADADGTLDVCAWPITDFSVYGLSRVHVGVRDQILEPEGAFAHGLVAKRDAEGWGFGAFFVSPGATTGDALSGGNLRLDNSATVDGNVLVGGSLSLARGARVLGSVTEHHAPSPALPALELNASFAAPTQGDVTVPFGGARVLPPGRYRNGLVFANATLTLSAGDYYFETLVAPFGSRINVDSSAGPVRVFVKSLVSLAGSWSVSDPTQVLLGYAGNLPFSLSGSFKGTILAPRADVTLGGVLARDFSGAILAEEVTLLPDVVLRHYSFRGPWPWIP